MSNQTKALLCEYRHDPVDRLSAQTTPGQTATQRFYQGNHLATEVQGQQRRAIIRVDDQPLAQQQHTSNSINTAILGTDRQGSVLQMLTATASQRLAYTAYGHQSPESGLLSVLGFNGERRDPVTGHYQLGNGYRAFNPVLMCFNSPDSLSPFDDGGLNCYAYCSGDPINYLDPTGHSFFSRLFRPSPTRPGTAPPPRSPVAQSSIPQNISSQPTSTTVAASSNLQRRTNYSSRSTGPVERRLKNKQQQQQQQQQQQSTVQTPTPRINQAKVDAIKAHQQRLRTARSTLQRGGQDTSEIQRTIDANKAKLVAMGVKKVRSGRHELPTYDEAYSPPPDYSRLT